MIETLNQPFTRTFASRQYGASVSRESLKAIRAPQSMGRRHMPVPHIDLVESLSRSLFDAGFAIGREQFSVSKDTNLIVGTMDIFQRVSGDREEQETFNERTVARSETVASIGFRSANDMSESIRIVSGKTVMACTNGVLSGDAIVMNKMHTPGLRLQREVDAAMQRALDQQTRLDAAITRLKNTGIDSRDAKVLIYDAVLSHEVCAPRYLPHVARAYFGEGRNSEEKDTDLASRIDCMPRSVWGLHNAFTRVFRDQMDPSPRFLSTTRLGAAFGIRTEQLN